MANGYSFLRPDMFQHFDQMDKGFLIFLDNVMQGCGWYTKFTSDFRDPEEQAGQTSAGHGAAKLSLHESGKAVDIRMPWITQGTLIDHTKLGSLADSICLYRKGIQVELEIDITPNDPHVHIGWFGFSGPLRLEPTCRHAA